MAGETVDDLYIPTWDDVLAAHERVRPYIHKTPILTSRFINELAGCELYFKCENLQKAGAFKVRGASNAVFGLSDEKARKGVATHSSGNHALSLSYAAGRRGIPCHVVMPRTAPQAKKDAVRGYGGIITECEPSTSSREETFARIQAETGADFVHPYNDERVIAGQATCSKEIIEELGALADPPNRGQWKDELARSSEMGRAGPGARDRAGSDFGRCPDVRVDEPRGTRQDCGARTCCVFQPLAQQAVVQGRGVRPCADRARCSHRLR